MVKTCLNTHEISVIFTYENEFSSRDGNFTSALDPRLQKEQAEADEKKRRKEAVAVSHLRLGKVGEGHLKKLPKILGISFGKQKLRRLFLAPGDTHFWRFYWNAKIELGCMSSFLWTFLQAQWEERVAKHVAYKEKFEVEAEEAHLRTTW